MGILCNGDTPTLLRWGDSLKEEMAEMFETGSVGGNTTQLLLQPNMFGLHISYNSYKNKLIDDPLYMKGWWKFSVRSDGFIYVAPCYTAFFRECLQKTGTLYQNFYSFRRIIRM